MLHQRWSPTIGTCLAFLEFQGQVEVFAIEAFGVLHRPDAACIGDRTPDVLVQPVPVARALHATAISFTRLALKYLCALSYPSLCCGPVVVEAELPHVLVVKGTPRRLWSM